jgi:hypothetical protein
MTAQSNKQSFLMFNETELGRTLETLDPSSQHFRLPFKYRTVTYIGKILAS